MNKEWRDILISALVISLAFGWKGVWPWIKGVEDASFALVAVFGALVAVGSGFILHELSHRYMGRKFGANAEYRAWRTGLILSLVTAIVSGGSFIFAAPGAVRISPNLHHRWFKQDHKIEMEELGIISIAGPVTNLILSGVFLALSHITGIGFFNQAAWINAWLALFNSFPIPPLDGSKILAWDVKAWSLLTATSIIAVILI